MTDQDLIERLEVAPAEKVGELAGHFVVSQTAIRFRLKRLIKRGCVVREAMKVPARGRPAYIYRLTVNP
jgi:predicted ArsR family transcriptional regulator